MHKLALLQATPRWLRPTACSELLARLPGSAHTFLLQPFPFQKIPRQHKVSNKLNPTSPLGLDGTVSLHRTGLWRH